MASHYELKPFRDLAAQVWHHQRLLSIYKEGFAAGEAGVDTTACPYRTSSESGSEWFAGYKEGRKCQNSAR